MVATRKQQPNWTRHVLWVVTVALVIACVCLVFALAHKTVTAPASSQNTSPSISLGTVEYQFAGNRAIKQTDNPAVNSLKVFLNNDARHEGCSVAAPAYEHVVAYTKDKTQVFIKYGCGAADSPIYAVQTAGAWKMLSPTNHFDYLGMPDCQYLTTNNISTEIAPVCANDVQVGAPAATPKYLVR